MALVPYVFKCTNPECKNHQKEYEVYLDRDAEHKSRCPACRHKAQRVFSLGAFTVDFRAGFDVGLGRYVNTKMERENFIAERGIRKIGC